MSLIYGLQTFLVYLVPSYLFFLRVWVERLDIKEHFDLLTIPLFVISGSGILLYIFLLFPLWNSNTLFHTLFYFISFWILYVVIRYKHFKIGFFNIFFYSVLSVFIVSELWEIPIIIESLQLHNLSFNIQHITLAGLKLLSIPVLTFYMKKDFAISPEEEGHKIRMNTILFFYVMVVSLVICFFLHIINIWTLIKIGILLTLLDLFWSLKAK